MLSKRVERYVRKVAKKRRIRARRCLFARNGYPLLASKPPVCCKEKKSRKKGEYCCMFPGETCHQIQAQWDDVHMGNAIIRSIGGKKMLFDIVTTSSRY